MVIHINIIKLLNLAQYENLIRECSISVSDAQIDAWIELKNETECVCPHCGFKDIMHIKDHPTYEVLHVTDKHRPTYLHVANNRLLCPCCKRTFTPTIPFVFDDFPKLSALTVISILDELQKSNLSFSEIARNHWTSDTTVKRIFEARVCFSHGIPTSYMCIDEKCYIHGNTKYCLPILDFRTNTLIDICKDRRKATLKEWLRFVRDNYVLPPEDKSLDTSSGMSKNKNRTIKLECICIDMSQNFYDSIHDIFPYVRIAVDSFHVVKNVMEAMQFVRIRVMKRYYREDLRFDKVTGELLDEESIEARQPVEYRAIKKYWKLLALDKDILHLPPEEKRYNSVINKYADQADVLDFVLSIDRDLCKAWQLKERYCYFNRNATMETAPQWLDTIIADFTNSHLKPFVDVAKTLEHWKPQIINSFIRIDGRRISNGPMEGMNSKIEKLIVNSNGIPKLSTLRSRALLRYGNNSRYSLSPKKK